MSLYELIVIILEHNYTIKQILTHEGAWWTFYEKHQHRIRLPIIIAVLKLISCKNIIRGVQEFSCPNQSCSYVKWVCFTCKSKACSSCCKKATSIWLNKQFNILPRTPFQHITFTMPDVLWDFFWYNRYLLNLIALLDVDCINRGNLIIPRKISQSLNHTFNFNNFLDQQYQKYWHVHCAKPSNSYKKDLKYLSRYIKRPPIAESRLKHYDGHYVAFKYLDHKTKLFRHFKLTDEFNVDLSVSSADVN